MSKSNGINIWVRVIGVLIAATLVSVFIIKDDPKLAKQKANDKANTVANIAKGMVSNTGEVILGATISTDKSNEAVVSKEVIKEATEKMVADMAENMMDDTVAEVADTSAPAMQDAPQVIEAETVENVEPVSEVTSDIQIEIEQVEANVDDIAVEEVPAASGDE
ncbi:MAG: hypothetical protein L3J04_02770 [Robiginitomaculum sp.]|nr:hypothetical protein [Robiginitomaculum sp.]